LEKVAVVLRLELLKMGVFVCDFRVNFGFDLNFEVLFDLDDNVTIHGLSLIQGLVFVKLENNGHLSLIGHGQDKAFVDVFVVYVVTVRGAMEPKILFVKINRVFSPGDCQVYVD
jgi:hypothetical protein